MSATQQDISRDFLTGSRAAWVDLNARGGVQGKPVQHLVLETDGTTAQLQSAWKTAHQQASCVALSGCAVVAVADAAVSVVATGVKITAKAVGAVADAVIPDGDDKPKKGGWWQKRGFF